MSTQKIAAAALFVIFAVGTCMAQGDVPKMVGNLDVYGIKKMAITSGPSGYSMMLQSTFTNANAEALKLRNGDFEVVFDRPKGGTILLGQTRIAEQIVPGKAADRPGQADGTLNVAVGPNSQATVDKLIEVINIISDPAAPLRISIRGKAEVGLQLPRGWVFEQGRRFEVDLVFTPALQREFLLK